MVIFMGLVGWLVMVILRCFHLLERAAGIEPACLAWKARALPLSYARVFWELEKPEFLPLASFFFIFFGFPKKSPGPREKMPKFCLAKVGSQ
jgi:hypothetical protein